MAKPRIVTGSEVKVDKEKPKTKEDEEMDWDIERGREGLVSSTFTPRKKEPGDLIMADDWNFIQNEIKDDLSSITSAVNDLAGKSSFLIASGVASHNMFVELNWGVKAHVILSYNGPLNGTTGSKKIVRCYPFDISEKGFRIYAQSDDGKEKGIVNWIAIGVMQ